MSAPQQPLPGSSSPYQPPPSGGWGAPGPGTPGEPGSWPAGAVAVPRPAGVRGVVLALAGAAVGAAVAALVVSAVLVSGARELVQEAGTAAGEGIAAALAEQSDPYAWSSEAPVGGVLGTYEEPPVEQFPAVAPGVLGPDPVLDTYATQCFGGDLQSCDDLYYEAPPLSDYEQYGGTCGGRVKAGSAPACTELD